MWDLSNWTRDYITAFDLYLHMIQYTLTELKASCIHHVRGTEECCLVEHVGTQSSVSGDIQYQVSIPRNTWNNPVTHNNL